ncbi:MAG: hypothetical protein ACLU9Q_11155 [Marvinbryantia sp.]|uniref:hypothetical protein n=1 Tax=Marvinbryantia sp. TaxID=2496532 RepID=UPI0025E9D4DD|nr:hypothetical protein [uncultured Marvinbryantia sp.]
MKKSSFVATILGTISVIFFALGMCMAMVEEWNAFKPGIVVGCVGLVFALITVFVWRKMEHKAPIKITGKAVLTAVIGIVGALALGVGMCFCMVWNNMILGIVIGLAGIVILLCLIPLCKGLK